MAGVVIQKPAVRTTWITNWPGCDEDEIKLYHRQTQYGEIITHTPRASERDRRCNERRDTFHTRLLFTAGPLLCCIIICWLCALNLLCSSEYRASPSAACYYTRSVPLRVFVSVDHTRVQSGADNTSSALMSHSNRSSLDANNEPQCMLHIAVFYLLIGFWSACCRAVIQQ